MKKLTFVNSVSLLVVFALVMFSSCNPAKVQSNVPSELGEPVFECNPPYMTEGSSCCLDENQNRRCDNEEVTSNQTQETTQQDQSVYQKNVTDVPAGPSISNLSNATSLSIDQLKTLGEVIKWGESKYFGYRYTLEIGLDAPLVIHKRTNRTIISIVGRKKQVDGGNIDVVLVDRQNRTARGTCLDGDVCARFRSYKEEFSLPYQDYFGQDIIEVLSQYGDERVVSIARSGMRDNYNTYQVNLDSGMKVIFVENYHFPIFAERPKVGIIFQVKDLSVETLPQQEKLQFFTPKITY